jgi:hypothetical protein
MGGAKFFAGLQSDKEMAVILDRGQVIHGLLELDGGSGRL